MMNIKGMKNIAALMMFLCGYFLTNAQDSTLTKLLAIDEKQFIGKPLDSIIAVLPPGIIEFQVASGHRASRANKLIVRYPGKLSISLHVREFTHLDPKNENMTWPVRQFRKEKLHHTVIFVHNTCYTNCNDY